MTRTTSSPAQSGLLRGLFNRACARVVVFVFMPNSGSPSNSQSSVLRQATSAISQGVDKTVTHLRPDRRAQADDESFWAVAKYYAIHGIFVAGILVLYLPSIAATAAYALLRRRNSGDSRCMRRIVPGCIRDRRRVHVPATGQQVANSEAALLQAPTPARGVQTRRKLLNAGDLDSVSRIISSKCSLEELPVEKCPICLDCVDTTTDVRVLACTHGFHATCIDTWLTACCSLCPMCKTDLGDLAASARHN